MLVPLWALWLLLAIALAAIILAYDARQSYKNAASTLETFSMNVQDLATHVAPMIAAIKVSLDDQSTLLAQIKADNAANGTDNTLVDQAIAAIDGVTAQANAAHEAVLAAAASPAGTGATITLEPSTASVAINGTQQFAATTSTGETPVFTLSPTNIGTVDVTGNFTAGGDPGSGVLTATLADGTFFSVPITVTPTA